MANSDDKYHVVSRGNNWAVKREGSTRAASIHATKHDAQRVSEKFQQQSHDVVIHNRDGTISEWLKGK